MWIRSFRASGQSAPALALGLLLASYANDEGNGVKVSAMTLASMLGGCSERTLNRYLNALISEGWVKRTMIENVASLRLAMPPKCK